MVQITPAILVTDIGQLKQLIKRYVTAGIGTCDVDIQEKPFASDATSGFQDIWEVISHLPIGNISLGWDLKMAQPEMALQTILTKFPKHRVYVYSSAELGFLKGLDLAEYHIGLGILAGDELPGMEVLQSFPEVQVMTVRDEKQGGGLDVSLLERTRALRSMGYMGIISIDGGVDLETVKLVQQYPIDRVSVGSYFQRSDDVQAAYEKLEAAFNR
jgi:pentose-5-phosphate-3-epimerase